MEKLKKPIVIPTDFHTMLKKRAAEKQSSIEKEIVEILRKEFHIQGD